MLKLQTWRTEKVIDKYWLFKMAGFKGIVHPEMMHSPSCSFKHVWLSLFCRVYKLKVSEDPKVPQNIFTDDRFFIFGWTVPLKDNVLRLGWLFRVRGRAAWEAQVNRKYVFLCNAVGLGFMHGLISVHTNLLQIHAFTQKCLLIIFTESLPLKANNIT